MQTHESKLVLSTPDHFHIILIDDIVSCNEVNSKTTVTLQNGEQYSVDLTLDKMRQKINREDFFQPQDNCLINGQYVNKLQRIEKPELLLENGQVFSISPGRKDEVLRFLNKITRIQI